MAEFSRISAIRAHLPTLAPTQNDVVFRGFCPFHADSLPTLVVQPHFDSACCLACGYGGNLDTLLADLRHPRKLVHPSEEGRTKPFRPFQTPQDSIGFYLNEEVSSAVYRHIFMGKIKLLAEAVARLQSLISRMKP